MTSVFVGYAARTDPDDRFSEVAPIPVSDTDPGPRAFPQRPGVLDALLGGALGDLPQNSDAFDLRIQAPAAAAHLPVLVFIPGGGFTTGSGSARWYDSTQFVERERFVLVTVNYRIGILGHHGPQGDPRESSRPLRDLAVAVEWVHANISSYGGDPSRITLAGDSAGAWYAHALSSTERLRGILHRTALVSMPQLAPLSEADWQERRAAVIGELGGESALRSAQVEAVLDAQRTVGARFASRGFAMMPAVTEETPEWLSDSRESANRMHTSSLLLLTTAEESAGFLRAEPPESFTPARVDRFLSTTFTDAAAVAAFLGEADPYVRMMRAATLAQFTLPALRLAGHAADLMPVTVARLDVRSPLERAYSPHCFTLPFLFGGAAAWHDAPMLAGLDATVLTRTAAELQAMLGAFVRGKDTPRYSAANRRRVHITEDGTSEHPAEENLLL